MVGCHHVVVPSGADSVRNLLADGYRGFLIRRFWLFQHSAHVGFSDALTTSRANRVRHFAHFGTVLFVFHGCSFQHFDHILQSVIEVFAILFNIARGANVLFKQYHFLGLNKTLAVCAVGVHSVKIHAR